MNQSRLVWFSSRNIRQLLVVVVLSAAGTAGAAPPPASAVSAEVDAAVKKFVQAWGQKDLGAALGAFAADAVVYDPVPPGVFDSPDAIKTWVNGAFQAMEHISITMTDVKIHPSGSVAWLTAHYVFKGQIGDNSVGDEGSVSMVWVKQSNGVWKLALFHASIPPPAAAPGAPPPGK